MKKQNYILILLMLAFISVSAQKQLWQEVSDLQTNNLLKNNRASLPSTYKLFKLDVQGLKNSLNQVANRSFSNKSNTIISFPNANGKLERFRVFETEIMHPDLAVKFPNIKTYVAQGIDDLTATMHFSITQRGLYAMTFSGYKSTLFIDAYTQNSKYCIVYAKNTVTKGTFDFECFTDDGEFKESVYNQSQSRNDTNDKKLRTFRLALSCNAEYGNIFAVNAGTEIADIMAQMVITMNRVNGVYERDLSVTMQFVANNNLIMYYGNTSLDPWSGEYNSTTQTEIDAKIGDANYDIGHNFNTSGGGNAGCIGCVCTSGSKGSGYTGRSNPTGDPFDIDYVAHEMGHQFGGWHTMNTCSRSGSGLTEVEPASGSSIMGYAGICPTNVQSNSDAHFNYVNIRDISANLQPGGVSTCAAITNLVNNPPVANAGLDYTIPKSTAYVLEGTATDPEGVGSLTYTWSQNDPEQSPGSAAPQSTYAVGPMYRSLSPSVSPNRYMPKFSDVLNGNLTPTWEVTPSVARNMEFAFLARDNDALGGQTDADLMSVTVDGTAGPFVVTSQNTAQTWDAGTTQTISWNVASTNVAPVNAANVDILITDDAGVTFTTVASNVLNNGSYNITVPNMTTSTARIMVRGSNNIFYAINSANITIQQTNFSMTFGNTTNDVCAPNNAVYTFTYNSFAGFSETVTFSATGNPAGSTVVFSPTSTSTNGTTVTMTVSNIANAMVGTHTINVQGVSASASKNTDVTLTVFSSIIPVVTLNTPADNSVGVSTPATLNWSNENGTTYDVEVATDNAFTTIIESSSVNTNTYTTGALLDATIYYWRVRVNNNCGTGAYSSVFSFTATTSCSICPSTYVNTSDDWITNVAVGTISNASVQGGANSYEDFTAISTDLEINSTNVITVSLEMNGAWTEHVWVWVDWNQDCDFLDADEAINLGTVTGTGTITGNIIVPAGALLGNTTMRIIEQYNADPTSCDAHPTAFGETEDYTINVIPEVVCVFNTSYTEEFETIPLNCWTFYQSKTDDPGFVQTTNRVHSGTYSFYHNDDNIAVASESWMVSPGYTCAANDEAKFWYNQNFTANYYNYSGVWISTTGNDPLTNPADWTELEELNATATNGFSEDAWSIAVHNLSAYAGQTIYIGFKYIGDFAHEFYVDDFSLAPYNPCHTETVWTGTWSNGIPDATTSAIIQSAYDTTTNGSFTACTLTIDSGIVTINANTYIEVINDLVNNGTLNVASTGSFVQVNDNATVTGAAINFDVAIVTTNLVDTGRYTYFSSPTQGETLATFSWSMTNRIWQFDSAIQDWTLASTADTMIPGKGYIIRPDPGQAFPYTGITNFNGPFNNGVITKALTYNAGGIDDDNTLVGNPYPSAINTALLLSSNPRANAFYFWTHENAANADGEFVSNDDYAVWNSSGGTSGNATAPAPTHIASGQGFFATANGNVGALELVFNNALRVTGNNNTLLRPESTLDKVWVNLTSGTNLSSQILIAFNPLCSDAFDAQYDAERINNTAIVAMSSQGTGSEVANLVIQTRSELTDDDTIVPLRLDVTDVSVVNYTISIDHFENLINENIYLKDNLLNVLHDLKTAEYNFALNNVGVNDTRFELLFSRNALSVNDNVISSENLFISNIDATNFKVQMRDNSIITNFKAFDVLGKLIIDINPNKSKFNTQTNIKSGTILLTKSTLENGQIISKKFIKK